MSEKEKKNQGKQEKNDTPETSAAAEKEQPAAGETVRTESEADKAKALADEYKDKWMRSVAEFDNYKKRNAKIWQDAFCDGKADVILKILPIGDNIDAAIGMISDEKTAEGLRLLKRKFDEVLASLEVTEINPVGEKFDPNIAEAVMRAEKGDGDESDTVKQVFQKGYKLKDKIIRYAKVSVIG